MSKFDSLKTLAHRTVRPVSLKLQNRAPEILTAAGVIGLAASGVLLVRQTLTVQPILEDHQENLSIAKSADPSYSDAEVRRDVAKVYLKTGFELTKHYGPAITIGAGGVVAILASNNILRKRNVAVVAAYKALEDTFAKYRGRVIEELGAEKELDIYRGHREIEIIDEETGEKKTVVEVSPDGFSPYSRVFDEFSPRWQQTREYNIDFLRIAESVFNDLLQTRGFVYLNEVYRHLGLQESKAGQIVGWSNTKNGDGFIDFGIFDYSSDESRDFVAGLTNHVRLDFNVDGPILYVMDKEI